MKVRLVLWTLLVTSPAILAGCHVTGGSHNLPPAERLMHPGPGVGGPGPGVMMPHGGVSQASYAGAIGGGAMIAGGPGCMTGNVAGGAVGGGGSAQVLFGKPESMQVQWDVGGVGSFDSQVLITPGRQNFQQGGVYRLKLTGITGREGAELYPTLAIYPASLRSAAYLAHNAIPVQFTDQDLDQVLAGNFVTKAVYIPDPEFQELAVGVDTLVSSPVDPGLDPIVEADRRGTILAVIRLGNKDLETPGDAPGQIINASYNPATAAGGIQQAVATQPMAAPPASFGETIYNDPNEYVGTEGCPDGCNNGVILGEDGGAFAGYSDGSEGTFNPGPGGMPPGLMGAGQYGMPISGTPIGLPGPPHVPLGVPAGLQKHVIKNWTHNQIPDPTRKVRINVKQRPGLSYPVPASRAWVTEDTIHPQVRHHNQQHGGLLSGLHSKMKGMLHNHGPGGAANCPTCQ